LEFRIMSDSTPTTPPPAASATPAPGGGAPAAGPAPRTFWQKATQWFIAACLMITGVLGIVKGYNSFFSLPSCSSDTATDTVKSIFKDKNVELTALRDFKSVTDTSSEKTCQAYVETPDERANIDYRIYKEGWTTKVMITEVKAQPK
jgi:hypothetical protein